MSRVGPPRFAAWLPWLLLAVPLTVLAWTVLGVVPNHFEIPYNDQWENIWWWRHGLERGGLPRDYLFSQHNEHRILLPRLVFLADLKWFRGANELSLVATGLIQLAAGGLFVVVARPTSLRWPGILALAVALALIWSAAQWENLVWGFQIAFLGVYAAGAWAIYLFCRAVEDASRVRWAWLALALAALAAATFNMANGLFAGIAMVLVGLLARRSWKAVLIAGLATAGLMALYLYGYKTVPHPAAPADGFVQSYITYVLAYLGNIWAFDDPLRGAAAGAAGSLATAVMVVLVATGRVRDPARLALLGIVLFVGMSAGITSFGRLGYGLGQALSSRYMTPACCFWAAQALFWGLTADGKVRLAWKLLVAAPLIAAVAVLPRMQDFGIKRMNAMRENFLLGSSAVIGGLGDDKALLRLYPEPERVRQFTPFLRSRGLSVFADDPGFRVGSQLPAERVVPPGACSGAFDVVAPDPAGGGLWQVLGWGWDGEQTAPFRRVLLSDAAGRITGVAMGGVRRDDVAKALQKRMRYAGWTGLVEPPAPGQPLTAYGVRIGGTLCEIGKLAPPG